MNTPEFYEGTPKDEQLKWVQEQVKDFEQQISQDMLVANNVKIKMQNNPNLIKNEIHQVLR